MNLQSWPKAYAVMQRSWDFCRVQGWDEVEVVEVYEDATATPEPAQEIAVEPEEEEQEEDHVQFDDKGGNEADSDDERMISDYDSEPEMSEDDVLKYIANEL